ncbi:MAG: glycosyltransferase, partial [Bdellovibrionia bacterium]
MLFRNCAIYTMLLSFSTQVVLAAYPPIGNTAAGPSNAAETFAQPSSDDFQDIRDVIEMYSEVCLTNNAPQAITGSTSATAPTDANSHAPSGLRKYCDPRFMLSLLDPRDTILPFTGKKAAFWLTLASLVAGLVVLEQYYPYSGYIAEGIRYNNTILLSILYGMEPLMIAFFLIAAQYPAANPIPNQTSGDIEAQISGSQTEDTALVIPCHNSQEKIVKTLEAALKHFRPEQIYIVDNGNTTAPTDQTQKIVKNIHPNINYIWLPIGNKNIAQFTGSMAAKNYKNILTTDDDVALPTNFKAPLQLFNDNVKAATFAIEAIDTKGKKPIFVGWQDIEYKFSDLSKLVESRFGGVMYPHGASSFWDRETFIEVLRRHDTVYYAEDVKLGLVLQKTGKRMAM